MQEINPMATNRAESWKLYIDASGYKLNMLICYCIAMAADKIREFKLLPVGRKMFEYDKIGINVIVANKSRSINTCDIPFSYNLNEFNQSYLSLTKRVRETCENYEIKDNMIIGTSSLVKYEIDGIINMYNGIFNNPFMLWGKYRQVKDKVELQVSFQFHHVQMDAMEACEFLEELQRCIYNLK